MTASESLDVLAAGRQWHPIARSDDAASRHVHQARLMGRELAVWRADDGYVNVWNNRCLHRGVRLSVGLNEGNELKCLYHGWRYSSRSGGCTYIPAHPADAPARTISTTTFPAAERYGLIWTTENGTEGPAAIELLDSGNPFALRALPFRAAPGLVLAQLRTYPNVSPESSDDDPELIAQQGFCRTVSIANTGADDDVVLLVQPVDSDACVVYGVLAKTPAESDQLGVLRHHANLLNAFRTQVEVLAAQLPRPAPLKSTIQLMESTPVDLGPSPTSKSRSEAELKVVVERKREVGIGVIEFHLASLAGPLPTTQPGAHIDVHLPNGLVRQYSLTNRSGDQSRYVIGVKLEPESRGGSKTLHASVREGDILAISAPRNNFSLRRDAVETLLIAGGIGVTPLLSMAETLADGGLGFTLHYFAQSDGHVAFRERLGTLGDSVVLHLGLSPVATGEVLDAILASHEPATHAYICGPGPMLDAARNTASKAGWPDEAVHFEYFKNVTEIDQTSSFDISLARSGLTLTVGPGETILNVLTANGVAIGSSCEQGACGTCLVDVIEGEPVHQDVYLNATERASKTRIVTCVSRSASKRLVLDI